MVTGKWGGAPGLVALRISIFLYLVEAKKLLHVTCYE
jgi:hypothetical protein